MRVSLVTGAGAGIGAAVARRLSVRGDRIMCADRDGSAAAAVAEELGGPGRAIAVAVDVATEGAGEAAVGAALAAFGRLDAVVACAGVERTAPAHEMPTGTVRDVLAVNVLGSFDVATAAARAMRAQEGGGSVVLVGSVTSFRALPGGAAYATSKGAVLMLAKALAVDWAPDGITVNVVAPGVTDTAMSAASLGDPERREALLARVPMRRPGRPEDIAAAVAFLTSPEAGYITGACLPVDGGWLAAG
ncbi:2-deoxy-D-gluconate 3-dehydrogenase [Quadrisphaera granulorum]|uniref:2-deoxy-D-gluconate 3-dehydrogenase n=1 Tax=Quadrisphaera granulorum TaxID=317664 RepID=A0A316A4Y6_9ACTN|nr:glucose 1-dehydrogenase [Quadrisphaera granulorum]PWJ52755.1 2-deoxy-D-gluconate 3-dehydrogenase [Quadrisphaera granulorum]SZE97360.1 2-deoxy-D-gluconate 3-dehydrogenase [Quadrisphaera granulorum]